jgi:hypothetical protein
MDPPDVAQAFAQPATGQEIAPPAGERLPSEMTITDGVITARKCEIERDESKVLRRIAVAAAAAGEDFYYRFPVKNRDGSKDWIEGPSIKAANTVARLYGNCQIDCRVIDAGATWIIYARFVDYETGFSLTRPFQQDKAQVTVKTKDAGRQQSNALQIGVSKAERNVVVNALETFTTFAFDEAQKNLVARVGKNLDEYRNRIRQRLAELGVDVKRVELTTGRPIGDWLAPDVARIIAELRAVADGMASADETWPPPAPPEPRRADFTEARTDQPDTPANPGVPKPSSGDTAGERTEESTIATSTPPPATPADSPADISPAREPAPPAKNWRVEGIVGEQNVIKAIRDLIDTADSPAEIDAVLEQNGDRMARMSEQRRAEIRHHANGRRLALEKERDA